MQRKADAENYSPFGIVEFTARVCIQQEYENFLNNSVRILITHKQFVRTL